MPGVNGVDVQEIGLSQQWLAQSLQNQWTVKLSWKGKTVSFYPLQAMLEIFQYQHKQVDSKDISSCTNHMHLFVFDMLMTCSDQAKVNGVNGATGRHAAQLALPAPQ